MASGMATTTESRKRAPEVQGWETSLTLPHSPYLRQGLSLPSQALSCLVSLETMTDPARSTCSLSGKVSLVARAI